MDYSLFALQAVALLCCLYLAAGDEASCSVTTSNGTEYTSTKTCYNCQTQCLTLPTCETMDWAEKEVKITALPTYVCDDAVTGCEGERLCVIIAENKTVLDASMKTCLDCESQCSTWDACAAVAWNYTETAASELGSLVCQPYDGPPCPSPSPFPDQSPAPPTSPEPLRSCAIFNSSGILVDNSDKDCFECQEQCVGWSQCSTAVFNTTDSQARTDLPTYKCPGLNTTVTPTDLYRCTVLDVDGLPLDNGIKTCYNCTKQCWGWAECDQMVLNFDAYAKPTVEPFLPTDCPALSTRKR